MSESTSAHRLGSNIGTLKGEGPATIKAALGIPAERRAWSVISIGHVDFAHRERYS